MKVRLLGLLLFLVLAAGEAPRTQFRYHPPAQSSWVTQGTVAVSTWIGWPGGPEATNEQSDVSWVDLVSESNPGQTILTRTMTRWLRRETGRDEAYPTAFPVGVTERLGLVESDFIEQPDLYPLAEVCAGESWALAPPMSYEMLPLGSQVLVLANQTHGSGRLTSLEPEVATLDIELTTQSQGGNQELTCRSLTKSRWHLVVDRASGVPLKQSVTISTQGTLTVDERTVPSRLSTTLLLTTRPAP